MVNVIREPPTVPGRYAMTCEFFGGKMMLVDVVAVWGMLMCDCGDVAMTVSDFGPDAVWAGPIPLPEEATCG